MVPSPLYSRISLKATPFPYVSHAIHNSYLRSNKDIYMYKYISRLNCASLRLLPAHPTQLLPIYHSLQPRSLDIKFSTMDPLHERSEVR